MSFPFLNTDNKELNKAYRLALSTLTCNTVLTENRQTGKQEPILNAGLFYSSPWVRDSSINTWNGAGLLCPDITENTLRSVVEPSGSGNIISERVGQSWDIVIWVIGAWYQYLYTGDREFLRYASDVAENTLAHCETNEFDGEKSLFRGPACYGDGVAAYPDIYAEPRVSAILAFAKHKKELCAERGLGIPMFALSTNCLYYYAYALADKMASELGFKERHRQKAENIRRAINRTFWSEEKENYTYISDNFGGCDFDETLGVSFAVLFGIAGGEKCEKIFKNHRTTPHGVPCVYPTFERYRRTENDLGRHSGTVWPFIQGFFADAAARSGRIDIFDDELKKQTENALASNQFAEIYHPLTGEVYGGLQEDNGTIRMWDSQPCQTWSATAYLRNIYMDLFGMRFKSDGIEFKPCGSALVNEAALTGLEYRNCTLSISIKGNGNTIDRFLLNGKESEPFIPADICGEISVEINLK